MSKRVSRSPKKRAKKVVPSVADQIFGSLAEFTDALRAGDIEGRLTVRRARIDLEPTSYTARMVRQVRGQLGVSQALFAQFLGCSANTVRAWEQGVNSPHPMASRFMDEIRRDPKYWLRRLQTAVVLHQ
jgi:DNA-binding transcriptional regulator YiaG